MTKPKPIVVAAVQPDSRRSVFTPEAQAELAQFAQVIDLGQDGKFTAEQMAAALAHAHGVITCWGTPRITCQMARQAKELKVIVHAAGSLRPVIDKEVLDLGLQVTSQAGAIARAVAEFTIGSILMGLRLTWQADRNLQASRQWHSSGPPVDLCWEVAGRTIGVISLSRVGWLVARKLTALEAKVIAYDPYADDQAFLSSGARKVKSLEALFDQSSVVTMHAPVTSETEHMVGASLLCLLPGGALIVNTARGVLFDQKALEDELVTGRLRAAIDVTDPEPPPADSRLYGLPNVLVTPHMAGLSVEARQRQGFQAVEDIRKALDGQTLAYAVRPDQWDILA